MLKYLVEFYDLLKELEYQVRGMRRLQNCGSQMNWPDRGVYFFFEEGEKRGDPRDDLRIVRVGTHAVSEGSGATLWKRLRQHKAGSRRGSAFRFLVGEALKRRDKWDNLETWIPKQKVEAVAKKLNLSTDDVREREKPMEIAVSEHIGDMPFLWVAVDDEPSRNSDRALIERNAIRLLSSADSIEADPASQSWLGRHSSWDKVAESGLWNRDQVFETPDLGFLDVFKKYIDRTPPL